MPRVLVVDAVVKIETDGPRAMRVCIQAGGDEIHMLMPVKVGAALGLMTEEFFAKWSAKEESAKRIAKLGGLGGDFTVNPPDFKDEREVWTDNPRDFEL